MTDERRRLDEPLSIERLVGLTSALFASLNAPLPPLQEQTSTEYDESYGYPYSCVRTRRRWLESEQRGLVVTCEDVSHPRMGDGWTSAWASIVGLPEGVTLALASSGDPNCFDSYTLTAGVDAAARVEEAWLGVLRNT
jgi:hypothetical protein